MSAVIASIRPSVVAPAPAARAGAEELTEISQLSVHLAALERTLLPVAVARISDGQAQAAELRRRGRELARALHWLQRHLTGDALAVRWPRRQLTDAVRMAAASQARAESAVVDALRPALSDREIAELSRSYRRAALAAPTRPHPSLSFRGLAGRIVFKLAAFIDATRDGLDNRSADDIRGSAARTVRHLSTSAASPSLATLRRQAAVTSSRRIPVQL